MRDEAKSKAAELGELSVLATPNASEFSKASSAQYGSIMYFVDKAHAKDPTTCTGKPVAKPITGVSLDECAHACDSQIHDCVGFSYYPGLEPNLCFLFSKFTEVKHYTKCGGTSPLMTCMAKLSKFEGT